MDYEREIPRDFGYSSVCRLFERSFMDYSIPPVQSHSSMLSTLYGLGIPSFQVCSWVMLCLLLCKAQYHSAVLRGKNTYLNSIRGLRHDALCRDGPIPLQFQPIPTLTSKKFL